jgi:hypothetical protein
MGTLRLDWDLRGRGAGNARLLRVPGEEGYRSPIPTPDAADQVSPARPGSSALVSHERESPSRSHPGRVPMPCVQQSTRDWQSRAALPTGWVLDGPRRTHDLPTISVR